MISECVNTASSTLTFSGKASGTYKNVAASTTVYTSWVCDYINGTESNCNSGSTSRVGPAASATQTTNYWLHTVRGEGNTMEGIATMSGIASSTIYSLNGGAKKLCKTSTSSGRHLLQDIPATDDVRLHAGPGSTDVAAITASPEAIADLAAAAAATPLDNDDDLTMPEVATSGGTRPCYNRWKIKIPCPPGGGSKNVTTDARPADLKCFVPAGTVLRIPRHPAAVHLSSTVMFPDLHDAREAFKDALHARHVYVAS